MFKGRCELDNYVVLDANDVESEGNFTSSTGKSVEWFNWREGEPNNQGGEHHVDMYVSETASAGKWNDVPDWFAHDIVCEYDYSDDYYDYENDTQY